MNAQQQAMLAQAQAMQAAQGGGAGTGGMTPQQRQMMAQAQAMASPQQQAMMQQQQQMAMQQQQMAMQQQQQQAYPPAAPMGGGGDANTITVSFPDGCMVGYDRLRNELILNGNGSTMRLPHGSVPARPQLVAGGAGAAIATATATPCQKSGTLTKLGFKKSFLGESWQPRHIVLTPTFLSYAKDGTSAAINSIPLTNGLKVAVANATTPARKDRFEDGDHGGVMGMATQTMGQMASLTGGPLGKDHCVEIIVPAALGNVMDTVMNSSATGLAFGGGAAAIKKNVGRTYYLQCSNAVEAQEWANAITNNINALPQDTAGGLTGGMPIGGAAGYAGLNNVMNNMTAMQASMGDSKDPTKSLGWYKTSLNSNMPLETLHAGLDRFYNDLDRAGVPHP